MKTIHSGGGGLKPLASQVASLRVLAQVRGIIDEALPAIPAGDPFRDGLFELSAGLARIERLGR